MPCNGDYLNPTEEESNKVQVSKLIRYVDRKLGIKTENKIIRASRDIYGTGVELDYVVLTLCHKISCLSKKDSEEIVYNAKDKDSRELAGWWEEHQKADRKRIKLEKEEKKKQELIKKALKKLSSDEIEALNIK